MTLSYKFAAYLMIISCVEDRAALVLANHTSLPIRNLILNLRLATASAGQRPWPESRYPALPEFLLDAGQSKNQI